MENLCTIIYANRDKEPERIRNSFNSLRRQTLQNFEVVFVDYGSDVDLVSQYKKLCADFTFVRFYHLPTRQLLWNKSKTLNYGILKAKTPYIFIADVDIIFHSKTLELFNKVADKQIFQLFKLCYLDQKESSILSDIDSYDNLNFSRTGDVNGMILVSKEALKQIFGFDEFFHFYGAEDEDLFARLENAGYDSEYCEEKYFYHNWHTSFSGTTEELSVKPRIKNIMRINQRHYIRNRELGITIPKNQIEMGRIISSEVSARLNFPDRTIDIRNIKSHIEHFLREELKRLENFVIKVIFKEDPYYNSLKYKTKILLKQQSIQYISMKEVNDMVLKEILFNYRDKNYSFQVSEDFKAITFCLEL